MKKDAEGVAKVLGVSHQTTLQHIA